MKNTIISVAILMALLFPLTVKSVVKKYPGKKILLINSYHQGYFWSDGEQEGVVKTLANTGIQLTIIYMDTKNNPSNEFCKEAGLKAKKAIEEFKPDVVITGDDNAFQYVIMPYYRNAQLPVVFYGINWDITVYGAPYKNTTGMIEISLVESNSNHLKKFAKGNKLGVLGFDSLGERDTAAYIGRYFKGEVVCMEFVKDFQSWKQKFLEIQNKADMIYITSPDGIKNWDIKEAEKFVLENVRIPTCADTGPALATLALLAVMKVPQEEGEYAAFTALRILDGEKPSSIPIVTNKRGDLYLNLKIAEKLNAVFPPSMLRSAKMIVDKDG
ncbi:MAG: ABC transporter substrate binding protein [Candidatus Omnitrophota bacterium]